MRKQTLILLMMSDWSPPSVRSGPGMVQGHVSNNSGHGNVVVSRPWWKKCSNHTKMVKGCKKKISSVVIHSFIHSFTLSFIQSSIHSLCLSFSRPFIHLFVHLFIRTPVESFTNSLIYSIPFRFVSFRSTRFIYVCIYIYIYTYVKEIENTCANKYVHRVFYILLGSASKSVFFSIS